MESKVSLLIVVLVCSFSYLQGSNSGPSITEKIDQINEANHASKCLMEGDIMPEHCANSGDADKRNAVRARNKLWRTRNIPYCLHSSLNKKKKKVINAAISDFHKYTCIRFTKVSCNHKEHFIYFHKGIGCWSFVGKTSNAYQKISIGNGCEVKGIVIHELMHALGFWHEQSRYDRDYFIHIFWNNIKANKRSNFLKKTVSQMTTLGLPYDYDGVMHYGAYAFAIDRKKPTIIKKTNLGGKIGQRTGFSNIDLAQLNTLYNCERKYTNGWSDWSQWSVCFKNLGHSRERRQRFCLNKNTKLCNSKKTEKQERACKTVSTSLWRSTACEGSFARPKCPAGYKIHLHSSVYGRTAQYLCNGYKRPIRTRNCRSGKARCVVKAHCQYKSSCSVRASNSLFGDPCRGTYKYLDIKYYCRRLVNKYEKVACEGRHFRIACPSGKEVKILSANYGRTDRNTCHRNPIRSTSCVSCNSEIKVKQLCQDRQSCSFKVSNSLFGDPCYGTYKYLRVVYSCNPRCT